MHFSGTVQNCAGNVYLTKMAGASACDGGASAEVSGTRYLCYRPGVKLHSLLGNLLLLLLKTWPTKWFRVEGDEIWREITQSFDLLVLVLHPIQPCILNWLGSLHFLPVQVSWLVEAYWQCQWLVFRISWFWNMNLLGRLLCVLLLTHWAIDHWFHGVRSIRGCPSPRFVP